jgi:hypothetical protein
MMKETKDKEDSDEEYTDTPLCPLWHIDLTKCRVSLCRRVAG